MSAPGVCLLGGGLLRGEGGIPACTEADTPPPRVNRITDTSKNITLATTSLRPATNTFRKIFCHSVPAYFYLQVFVVEGIQINIG